MAAGWSLDGIYFEACNCDAACPCVFLSAPTTGECTEFIGWHIARGQAGDRANAAQARALGDFFTGQRGGSPAKLASHIANDLGVRSVAPGHAAVVSRPRHLTYNDHGLDGEISEKTGVFSPFTYAGP